MTADMTTPTPFAPDATPAHPDLGEWRTVLMGLWRYGQVRPIDGVVYGEGTHRDLMKRAEALLDATPAQPVPAAGSEPVAWRCRKSSWDRPGWAITTSAEIMNEYDIVEPLYATPAPALAPQSSFWVIEKEDDTGNLTATYWDGSHSLSFTPDLTRAIQFHRRDDALWASRGWYGIPKRLVEHCYIPTSALAPQHGNRGLYDDGYQAGKKVGISPGRRLTVPSEPDLLPGLKRALEMSEWDTAEEWRDDIRAEIARITKERQL